MNFAANNKIETVETVTIDLEKDCIDITNMSPKVLDAFLTVSGDPDHEAIVVSDWTPAERRELSNVMGWQASALGEYWIEGR